MNGFFGGQELHFIYTILNMLLLIIIQIEMDIQKVPWLSAANDS